MPEITSEHIQQLSAGIAKLPPEQRAAATLQVHDELSQAILQQGKLLINGKLEIVHKPEQAEALAQKLLNENKPAETKPQPAAEQPAQPQGQRRTRKAQAEALAAAAPAPPAPKFDVVYGTPSGEAPAPQEAQPAAPAAPPGAEKPTPTLEA
jgi:hypothetical protein